MKTFMYSTEPDLKIGKKTLEKIKRHVFEKVITYEIMYKAYPLELDFKGIYTIKLNAVHYGDFHFHIQTKDFI